MCVGIIATSPLQTGTKRNPVNDFIEILKLEKGPNKFVVSDRQLQKINDLMKDNLFRNFKDWYNFFSQTGVKKLPILFSPFLRNHISIYDDQKTRAKYIVDYMNQHNHSDLVTMDGHGRLMYSLMDYIKSNELKQIKVHLMDIEKRTNDFHKKVFPKEIFESEDNELKMKISIPKEQDIMDIDTEYFKSIKNPFLYLNFCGISCCSKKKLSGREIVKRFIMKWLENHEGIMVSLSLRPHGLEETVDGMETNYGMLKKFNIQLVSKRSSFVTYMVTKN